MGGRVARTRDANFLREGGARLAILSSVCLCVCLSVREIRKVKEFHFFVKFTQNAQNQLCEEIPSILIIFMYFTSNPVSGHRKCNFVILGPKTTNKRQGKQRFRAGGAK